MDRDEKVKEEVDRQLEEFEKFLESLYWHFVVADVPSKQLADEAKVTLAVTYEVSSILNRRDDVIALAKAAAPHRVKNRKQWV